MSFEEESSSEISSSSQKLESLTKIPRHLAFKAFFSASIIMPSTPYSVTQEEGKNFIQSQVGYAHYYAGSSS